ncbi:MAG: hypothetical protein K2F95_06840 [Alistipes sp.]|nr:hypothetical protein [Alistipes sp.]
MKNKLKIAAIALLGFSTACCATRKSAKSGGDAEAPVMEQDTVEARIRLMYGVPMPDGNTSRVLSDEEAQTDRRATAATDNAEVK